MQHRRSPTEPIAPRAADVISVETGLTTNLRFCGSISTFIGRAPPTNLGFICHASDGICDLAPNPSFQPQNLKSVVRESAESPEILASQPISRRKARNPSLLWTIQHGICRQLADSHQERRALPRHFVAVGSTIGASRLQAKAARRALPQRASPRLPEHKKRGTPKDAPPFAREETTPRLLTAPAPSCCDDARQPPHRRQRRQRGQSQWEPPCCWCHRSAEGPSCRPRAP